MTPIEQKWIQKSLCYYYTLFMKLNKICNTAHWKGDWKSFGSKTIGYWFCLRTSSVNQVSSFMKQLEKAQGSICDFLFEVVSQEEKKGEIYVNCTVSDDVVFVLLKTNNFNEFREVSLGRTELYSLSMERWCSFFFWCPVPPCSFGHCIPVTSLQFRRGAL